MSDIYSELKFSEIPAIEQFKSLGYNYLNGNQESFSNGISNFGRLSQSDVILKTKLEQSFQRLNSNLKLEDIQKAIKKLVDLTQLALNDSQDLFNLNYQFYQAIKNGITIKVNKKDKKVKFIDFQNPENNDFTIINQLTIKGKFGYTKRPDLIVFINGIPLVIFEFKAPDVDIIQAYENNIQDYEYSIPQIFVSNAFIVLSNGVEAKAGSTFAGYDFYKHYNKITQEDENLPPNQENLIKVLFPKEKFIDILENFILYNPEEKKKILAQNHQIIGVNKAFEKVKTGEKKLGVFWHTQGSGKSFSMLFLASKIKRKLPGNWTFLIVTDRIELDKQIYNTFTKFQVNQEKDVHAKSIAHLKELLTEDHSFIFTLIHKFQDITEPINKRDDIIVFVDEGHRTQYGQLALNMHLALPNARFLAFTGTPLLEGDKITKDVFGDYVSIYNFSAAIKDKATVEIYYENRKPKLKLVNPDLDEQIKEIFEKYEVDDDSAEKISKRIGGLYKILTSTDRLKKIAKDIVYDYFFKPDDFKAMVVTIDKPTAYRMYFYIKEEKEKLERELESKLKNGTISDKEKLALRKIKNFDFAVVVSLTNTQGELEKVKKYGLDIKPIIERIQKEDLEKQFKDPNSKLKMVIVVSMWLTGFDVPSLRTLYLDKPMRNHTLMQTIARTNRVFPGKENGVIIDYIGIFGNLKKALENYAGTKGEYPTKDKEALFNRLKTQLQEYKQIFKNITNKDFDLIKDLKTDLFYILSKLDDKSKLKLKIISNKVLNTYKSLLPDERLSPYINDIKKIKILLNLITQVKPLDITALKQEIDRLIEQSIISDTFLIEEYHLSKNLLDLTKEKFEKNFDKTLNEIKQLDDNERRIQIDSLSEYLKQRLQVLSKKSNVSIKLREKLQKVIDRYNLSGDLDELIESFRILHKQITDKEKEILETNLSDEEYRLFEKLVENFKISNKKKIQELAKTLYNKIKIILQVYGRVWKEQENVRSRVKTELGKVLIDFCQQTKDKGCKNIISNTLNDVFNYVLKNF